MISCASLFALLGGRLFDRHVACLDATTCASESGVNDVAHVVGNSKIWNSMRGRSNTTTQEDIRRYRVVRDFWCNLPINRTRPILWELHDGQSVNVGGVPELHRLKVPFVAQCAKVASSVTLDDPPDYRQHLLLPDVDFLATKGYASTLEDLGRCDTVNFSSKNATIFFRGASTGLAPRSVDDLRKNTRLRAAIDTRSVPGWDVRIVNTVQLSGAVAEAAFPLVAPKVTPCEMATHKAVLDIDGNTNSWRGLFLKLHMNSIVIKTATAFRQWYYHRLQPFQDYIPTNLSALDIRRLPHFVQTHQPTTKKAVPEMDYRKIRRLIVQWWERHLASF